MWVLSECVYNEIRWFKWDSSLLPTFGLEKRTSLVYLLEVKGRHYSHRIRRIVITVTAWRGRKRCLSGVYRCNVPFQVETKVARV